MEKFLYGRIINERYYNEISNFNLHSYIYKKKKNTSHGILQFLSFDWITGRGMYMSSYTMDRKYGIFNTPIIPHARVGYEIVIANSYPTRAHEKIVEYTP